MTTATPEPVATTDPAPADPAPAPAPAVADPAPAPVYVAPDPAPAPVYVEPAPVYVAPDPAPGAAAAPQTFQAPPPANPGQPNPMQPGVAWGQPITPKQ